MTTTSSASSLITTRRRVTVLLFTWAAGSVDAITYLRAHVFTANMTGNSVLLALAIGQGLGGAVGKSVVALVAFILGVLLGAVLAGTGGDRVRTFTAVRREVFVEAAVLVGFVVACLQPTPTSFQSTVILVIGTSGVAMGMQSAAVKRLSIPGIATTYITGTITSLFSGLVSIWFTREARQARHAAEIAAGHAPHSSASMRHALGLQAQVFFSYSIAALVSSVLHRHWPYLTAFLPLAAITSIAIYMSVAKPAAQVTAMPPRQDVSA